MPIAIAWILMLASLLISLIVIGADKKGAPQKTVLSICAVLSLLLLINLYLISNTEQKSKTEVCEIHKIENIDLIVLDGNIINLNKKLGRSFEDKTQITLKVTQSDCLGVIDRPGGKITLDE